MLEGFTSNTHTCAIMQEASSEVELLDLPCTWTVRGVTFNTVTLPCKHTFHPTALAQHFAYRDMRCPVCRAGGDHSLEMHRSDIPVDVAEVILTRVKDMHDSDSESESVDHIDFACVREMLTTTAELWHDGSKLAAFTSRLIPNVETQEIPLQQFSPHRSFQRILLRNAQHAPDNGITVRFHVMHPVMLESITSDNIPIKALTGEFPMRCTYTGWRVLSRVNVTENDVCLHIDIAAVRNVCCETVAAHLEHFVHY